GGNRLYSLPIFIVALKRSLFSLLILSVAANLFAQAPIRRLIKTPESFFQKKLASTKSSIRSFHKKYPSKHFGGTGKHIFLQEKTTFTGNKGRISFDIELGEPLVTKSKGNVFGAEGKEFSTLSWTNLIIDRLPSGVS